VNGHLGGDLGAVLAAADAHAEQRRAGVLDDRPHVGEVEVDEPRHGDEVRDALDALAEDVVGVTERLDDARRALHHLDETIVGDGDDRVGHAAQLADTLLGLSHAAVALEVERLGHDGDGDGAQLTRHGGDHRRPAGARAAAFAGGHEHQIGAAQRRLELVA